MEKETLLLTLSLQQLDDIVLIRQRARQIMQFLGFRAIDQAHMTTAISEIGRNACQYASGGKVRYCVKDFPPQFLAYVSDNGKGITHLSSILESSRHTQAFNNTGIGIRGSKKLVDYFTINSSPNQGTLVALGIILPHNKAVSSSVLAKLAEDLVRNRPSASEEVQQQNKELLQALELLSDARQELEKQVEFRTKELLLANENLREEIEKRQKTEEKINNYRIEMNEAIRKSSLGELATSLAHEINQPLAAISAFTKGCINRINNDYKMTSEIFDILKEIANQAERAGEVVHRIKNFVRKGELFYETIDIHLLIIETINLMQHELTQYENLKIIFKFNKNILLVEADKIQLQQVILNLSRNAIEAMQEANTFKPRIYIKTLVTENNKIKVIVQDNGPGFSTNIAENLFNTYFTTKKQGTGLGLSICHSIIEAHGGKISANPLSKGGSSFEFILPIKRDNHE